MSLAYIFKFKKVKMEKSLWEFEHFYILTPEKINIANENLKLRSV